MDERASEGGGVAVSGGGRSPLPSELFDPLPLPSPSRGPARARAPRPAYFACILHGALLVFCPRPRLTPRLRSRLINNSLW